MTATATASSVATLIGEASKAVFNARVTIGLERAVNICDHGLSVACFAVETGQFDRAAATLRGEVETLGGLLDQGYLPDEPEVRAAADLMKKALAALDAVL